MDRVSTVTFHGALLIWPKKFNGMEIEAKKGNLRDIREINSAL